MIDEVCKEIHFLRWCSSTIPEATDLRMILVRRLVMSNQHDEAELVARDQLARRAATTASRSDMFIPSVDSLDDIHQV